MSPQFVDDLESAPSLSNWSSRPSSYETWVPYELPSAPEGLVIDRWTVIAEGAHGQIRRVEAHNGERSRVFCLKLFNEEWKDMYQREKAAYTMLSHHGVKRCIPEVYFVEEWPRWKFDGEKPDNYLKVDREEILYGLFMDYFEDCQELELKRATLRLAEVIGKTLEMIHEAGVIHRDIAERNILLVRESGKLRVVWIDFSCAWTGRQFERTRSTEWGNFRGFLYEGMVTYAHIHPKLTLQDRKVLSLETLNEKFPMKTYGETPHLQQQNPTPRNSPGHDIVIFILWLLLKDIDTEVTYANFTIKITESIRAFRTFSPASWKCTGKKQRNIV